MAGTSEDKLAFEDALDAAQFIGDLLQSARAAAQDDHFEAVIVVEMDMHRRNDHRRVPVLQLQ